MAKKDNKRQLSDAQTNGHVKVSNKNEKGSLELPKKKKLKTDSGKLILKNDDKKDVSKNASKDKKLLKKLKKYDIPVDVSRLEDVKYRKQMLKEVAAKVAEKKEKKELQGLDQSEKPKKKKMNKKSESSQELLGDQSNVAGSPKKSGIEKDNQGSPAKELKGKKKSKKNKGEKVSEKSDEKSNEEKKDKKEKVVSEAKKASLKKKQEKKVEQRKIARQEEGQFNAFDRLSLEEMKKKVDEIQSREKISKTAMRKLRVLKKKISVAEGTSVNEPEKRKIDDVEESAGESKKKKLKKGATTESEKSPIKSENNVNEKKIKKNKEGPKVVSNELVKNKLSSLNNGKNSDKKLNANKSKTNKLEQNKGKGKDVEDEDEDEDEDEEENEDEDEDEEEDEDEDEEEEEEETNNTVEKDSSEEDESESAKEEVDEEEEKEEENSEDEDEEDEDESNDADSKEPIKKEKNAKKTQKEQGEEDKQNSEPRKKRFVLFVANLPYTATAVDIKKHFLTKVSMVTSVRIPLKPETNEPRGFAYVEVENQSDYEKALSLHDTSFNGRRMRVEYTMPGSKTVSHRPELVHKNKKLHAMRKAGMLEGSEKPKFFKKPGNFGEDSNDFRSNSRGSFRGRSSFGSNPRGSFRGRSSFGSNPRGSFRGRSSFGSNPRGNFRGRSNFGSNSRGGFRGRSNFGSNSRED